MAADDDFLDLARKRFKLAESATSDQRDREREDLAFYAGDQWPEGIRAAREARVASGGVPETPARPCMTINKVRGPVRQVLNEQIAADMGITITAADDFGNLAQPLSDVELRLREGLVRRIQRHSEASFARSWAFERAAIAGVGWYRILTRYLEGTWDQEIVITRIFDQFSVSVDPSHQEPDGSDCEWEFIVSDVPLDVYEAEHGALTDLDGSELTDVNDDDWRALGDQAPGWFKTDTESKIRLVRVAEYFYTVRETREIARLLTAQGWMDLDPALIPADAPPENIRRRTDVTKRIKWAKITGRTVLSETDWPCPYMPLVKVTGEELQPYDGKRVMEGIVRPAISSNQGFNYMVSKQVESVGLMPIPPWQVAEGTIEGYEKWYEVANTRALPWLPYKQRDLEGNPAPAPQRILPDIPIQAIAQSVAMFDQAVQSTTMIPDPTLGQADPSVRSGRTVQALVAQSQRGTSNYMTNLIRAMHYEAKIINSLLPVIYPPGRVTRILNAQVKPEAVQMIQLTPAASFNIAIKVAKNFDTRRQEEAALVGSLIEKNPEFMTWFGDLFLENLDGPGHQEMAERAKVMLAPPIQQVVNKEMPIPPQAQMQLQQQHELIQALQQELTRLQQILQGKQVESAADVQQTQMDNATKLQIAEINAGTQLTIANLKAQVNAAELAMEELRAIVDAAKEAGIQGREHAHDRHLLAHELEHDRTMQREKPEPVGS